MKRPALFAACLASGVLAVAASYRFFQIEGHLNSTGKEIRQPAAEPVGSYPVQMRLSPNGQWLVVTNTGFRQQLSVIDTATGRVASKLDFNAPISGGGKESLYWGLEFQADTLYVSRGPEEKVSVYTLGSDGKLTHKNDIENPKRSDAALPNFVSGLACDGGTLYALNNETGPSTEWKGTVSEIDLATGQSRGKISVGGFPLSATISRDATGNPKEVWVTSEQDGVVSFFHPGSRVAEDIQVGANPTSILARGDHIYVTNAGSDTVSIIDANTHTVTRTILLRPAQMRSLPFCTPLGMDLSKDGTKLYVACADMNAVAVVDVAKGSVDGYIPVGWYPTDVKLTLDGEKLFVSNAKGNGMNIPNGRPIGKLGTYIQNIIEGTVSMLNVGDVKARLADLTQTTFETNRIATVARTTSFKNPGIKHVIYIIKENRTYDNVLGDLQGGNGDPSLCLFPRDVTPNEHALAERFVLLDNFYCCAEVSGDGWNWSTAGAANEYVSRNVPFNYSGRGRDYDFEGTVNGANPEAAGVRDVAAPPGGYIWDACRKSRVSMRNFGFFVGESDALGVKAGTTHKTIMAPHKKALEGVTDPNFDQFDMDYPDSELNQSYGIRIPSELTEFGDRHAPSRFTEWKTEFDGFVKSGNMPQFQMVRFCRDHTAGTAANKLSPRAMVADCDYAVGQLVEAVSHSKFWKDTAICIVEDDAQSGIDHVDCHRSTAYMISPYIRKGTHERGFHNTDGMLRTMELLLGISPMNGFDAIADPISIFASSPDNIEPYEAIKPDRAISGEVNKRNAYRSRDSAKIKRFTEESEVDEDLNDILWGAIKGHPLKAAKLPGESQDRE